MDNAKLFEEYKDATIFLLMHSPSGNSAFDLKMRERLYHARIELAKRKLLELSEYVEAVLTAHRIAND